MPAPSCPEHGRLHFPNAPRYDCVVCWALFGKWCAVQVERRKVQSVGRAKGGGQSSKAKGRTGVAAVARLLCERLSLPAEDVFVKAGSQVGVDINLSEAAKHRFPFAIEVKNQEALNIWQALAQAAANATEGLPPIVFFKRANTRLFVALDALTFMDVLKRHAD